MPPKSTNKKQKTVSERTPTNKTTITIKPEDVGSSGSSVKPPNPFSSFQSPGTSKITVTTVPPSPWVLDFPENNVRPKVEKLESKTSESLAPELVDRPEKESEDVIMPTNKDKPEESIINQAPTAEQILEKVMSTNVIPKKMKNKKKVKTSNKSSSLEILIKNMSKSIKTDNNEIKDKLEAIETKQDSELSKINHKVAQLEENIERSNKDNDKKIEEALKEVNKTVADAKKDSEEKLIMMTKMMEQLKEQGNQKTVMSQVFQNSSLQPSGSSSTQVFEASPIQPSGTTLTQAQVIAKSIPKQNPQRLFQRQQIARDPPQIRGEPSKNQFIPKKRSKFLNSSQEKKEAFRHALEWLGLFVKREEILAWIGDPAKINFTDSKLIRCQTLDGPRRNCFAEKIENFTSLHLEDIEIHEYFVSSNNGMIAWLHMNANVVDRIMRETSKVPAKEFKVIPYVPDIARDRKKAIDSLLLGYKSSVDKSLRYIIKNDDLDLKVLLKRQSDYDFIPYREINLRALGKLPALKTITQDDKRIEDLVTRVDNAEDFRPQRKRKQRNSPKKLPLSKIYDNLTSFLNGYEVDNSENESEPEAEDDLNMEDVENTTLDTPNESVGPETTESSIQTNL